MARQDLDERDISSLKAMTATTKMRSENKDNEKFVTPKGPGPVISPCTTTRLEDLGKDWP